MVACYGAVYYDNSGHNGVARCYLCVYRHRYLGRRLYEYG
jgi:hypothetical protein